MKEKEILVLSRITFEIDWNDCFPAMNFVRLGRSISYLSLHRILDRVRVVAFLNEEAHILIVVRLGRS